MLPEEQELARLETEQAEYEEQVASAELTLETLKIELSQFQYRYYSTTGPLYVELDELDAQIALVEAGQHPDDVEAQFRAQKAQEQARRSAEEAGVIEKSPPPPPEITRETKQAFRKAAKLMFPDHAPQGSDEWKRRSEMMSQVNSAYQKGDLAAIEKLIVEFGEDPEAIQGDDTGSRLVKAFRRIAQLRRRLAELEKELTQQHQHELYELMTTIVETETMGGDPLGDLVQDLMRQISERKIKLEILRQELIA